MDTNHFPGRCTMGCYTRITERTASRCATYYYTPHFQLHLLRRVRVCRPFHTAHPAFADRVVSARVLFVLLPYTKRASGLHAVFLPAHCLKVPLRGRTVARLNTARCRSGFTFCHTTFKRTPACTHLPARTPATLH